MWPADETKLYGPGAKSCLSTSEWLGEKKIKTITVHHIQKLYEIQILVSINRAVLGHSQAPSFPRVCGCFRARTAELGSCGREQTATELRIPLILPFMEKSVPIPDLKFSSQESTQGLLSTYVTQQV